MNANEHESHFDLQDSFALYLPFVNIRVHSWLKYLFLNAECNQPFDLKWRQHLECGDLSPHSKNSGYLRTAIILHIVDAIEV